MIYIRLKGGMGNQMFQYAFAMGIAKNLNTTFTVDLSSLLDRSKGDFVYRNYDLDVFKVDPNFAHSPALLKSLSKLKSSRVSGFFKKQVEAKAPLYKEKAFHFDNELIDNPKNQVTYEGWWQSEKYFEHVADDVREAFQFRYPIIDQSRQLHHQILSTNAVCLNVRRTDFLKVDVLNTTNLEYFLRGANFISDNVDEPHFYIFSDDMKWCQQNIKLEAPTTFVTHEHKGYKFGNYLQLMSACRHFIIPNSSFAWWAVWLNSHQANNVVAPKNWFNHPEFNGSDLVLSSWTLL